jgi:hypothetical protein
VISFGGSSLGTTMRRAGDNASAAARLPGLSVIAPREVMSE